MMTARFTWLLLVLVVCATGSSAWAQVGWSLSLPDTLQVKSGVVTLEDLAVGPVPGNARDLVIRAGLEPNTVVSVSRQDVLRRLVTAGLSSGVRMTGASVSYVVVSGRELSLQELEKEVRSSIRPLIPSATEGAPASWFELELPDLDLSADGQWSIELDRHDTLVPGRNLVRVLVINGDREAAFAVPVIFHQFGELATLGRDQAKNNSLTSEMFSWQWRDLSEVPKSLAVGRESIMGCSSARSLKAGQMLRQADLKETPVVRAGDSVDLRVIRGQVCVTVRAVARQDGCLGQNIPVKNELTGRLVNARVSGPGFVEWRK
jgi:flagella basal body P-ring formation protein FlgA